MGFEIRDTEVWILTLGDLVGALLASFTTWTGQFKRDDIWKRKRRPSSKHSLSDGITGVRYQILAAGYAL